MASSTVVVRFSSFCLFLLLACSSPRARARESQFFSKASLYDITKTPSPAEEELPPVKKEVEEPFQYKPENGNGNGLYGHGAPKDLPPANPSTSTYNYNTEENYNAENAPSEFSNNEFGGVSYGNKEFTGAGSDNKPTYNAGNIPESDLNGGSNYKYNKEPNTRHPTYAKQRDEYGMSDTRFLENGKYFYDVGAEGSYRNGKYDPAKGNPQAYGSFGGGETFGNGGYSYGNNNKGSGYEENNSVQEYQNTQENEEYAP